jgi:hypothetical protein
LAYFERYARYAVPDEGDIHSPVGMGTTRSSGGESGGAAATAGTLKKRAPATVAPAPAEVFKKRRLVILISLLAISNH